MARQYIFSTLLGLSVLYFSACGKTSDFTWQNKADYRYRPIFFGEGETNGFVELDSSQTGVTAANHIGEKEILSNRHLMNGAGVALGDVNNDGWIDIYIARTREPNILYINKGNWQFEDYTEKAGVACPDRYSTGAVFADIDGDGDLDLLVTALGGPNSLFINNGKGKFKNATQKAGLMSSSGSTTLALADVDGDGDLDLYITNYKRIALRDSLPPPAITWENTIKDLGDHQFEINPDFADHYKVEIRGNMLIRLEMAEKDHFYINEGRGKFRSVSFTQGAFLDEQGLPLQKDPKDWGLMAQFRDINNDLYPDLYVCNDFESPDHIWLNNKDGTFTAIPSLALRHTSNSSMAVDFADLNKDGLPDIFVTDMMSQSHILRKTQMGTMIPIPISIGEIDNRPQYMRNTFFVNRGDNTYIEIAQYSGIQASDWSWSSIFMDVDLDGHEDILVTTGHLYDVQDSDSNTREKEAMLKVKSFDEYKRLIFDYPGLELKNLAFRNLGNLKFVSVKDGWGIGSSKDISHGLAYADLDNDGDLDLVINRLNKTVGIFRNDVEAPRLAIRLIGNKPNTQAIGAKITLKGGPVIQTREIISGGRYLSGSDPLQVFAVGDTTNNLTAIIRWRDGTVTEIEGLKPNHLYEINQKNAEYPSELPEQPQPTMFTDVSNLLNHTHHEDPFDDFSVQSLLPNSFSQLGPGIAWIDEDNDGDDDLFIAGGKGGTFMKYENLGQGQFKPIKLQENLPLDQTTLLPSVSFTGKTNLIAGFSNLESTTNEKSFINIYEGSRKKKIVIFSDMIGPMTQVDYDGDGDLDLFIGGRVMPRQYPKPATSYFMKNENGEYIIDQANVSVLQNIGLVSGAVFTDIDNDNDPDLLLALEWGPILLFENKDGFFSDATRKWGLDQYKGWWNGIATGDFNGDGLLDIVATNWGVNSKYHMTENHSLRVYYNDFDNNDVLDIVESHFDFDFNALVPERGFSCMSNAMPFIRDDKQTYRNYAESSLFGIFGPALEKADILEANILKSMVFLNTGSGFIPLPLPFEAQITPAFHASVADLDGDGHEDIFLSQNFFATQSETDRNDSGRGLILLGDGTGHFEPIPGHISGILVYGEQRGAGLADYDRDGRVDLVITQNGAETKLYHNQLAKPGIRVKLEGSRFNPWVIGAKLQLIYPDGTVGATREIQSGSGYWSHNSPVQVLTSVNDPSQIQVTWPNGKITSHPISRDQKELTISMPLVLKQSL